MRRAWPHWNKSDGSIINGGMVLNRDFKEFIQSLNDNHVRYLLIGGRLLLSFFLFPFSLRVAGFRLIRYTWAWNFY
jgi:hypothetical protein